jgi:predicted ATP-grasp superfamily ATP-dependent carboligase
VIAKNYFQQLTGQSRRKVWFSNINWEQQVPSATRLPGLRNPKGDELVTQMDTLQLLLADEQDTVCISGHIDPEYLDYMSLSGIRLPHIRKDSISNYHDLMDTMIVPYFVDRDVEQLASRSHASIFGPPADLAMLLNDKLETRAWCENNGFNMTNGAVCHHKIELIEAYERLVRRWPDSRFVVKASYGSSGKNMFHIRKPADFTHLIGYLDRQYKEEQWSLSIERWHPIRYNLNTQLFLQEGRSTIIAVTGQYPTDTGVYRGSDLHPIIPKLEEERYTQEMLRLGDLLIKRGYSGIVGIDSMVDEEDNLIPVLEINARLTMVTYTLGLRQGLIEGGYRHMATKFSDFRKGRLVSFSEVYDRLRKGTTDLFQAHFFVYGFHQLAEPSKGVYYYRIFLLLWGEDSESIQQLESAITRLIMNGMEEW